MNFFNTVKSNPIVQNVGKAGVMVGTQYIRDKFRSQGSQSEKEYQNMLKATTMTKKDWKAMAKNEGWTALQLLEQQAQYRESMNDQRNKRTAERFEERKLEHEIALKEMNDKHDFNIKKAKDEKEVKFQEQRNIAVTRIQLQEYQDVVNFKGVLLKMCEKGDDP
jgi:hypothetical protein